MTTSDKAPTEQGSGHGHPHALKAGAIGLFGVLFIAIANDCCLYISSFCFHIETAFSCAYCFI